MPGVKEKVAVVGTAPSTRHLAPVNNEDWDIWACSPGNMGILNASRFYEIHDIKMIEDRFPDYFAWLQSTHAEVFSIDPLPNAFPFPADMIEKEFGPEFLSSTPAWMMAHAIMEHRESGTPKMIGLFGIDMSHETEYGQQKAGMWHFIKMAEKEGITVGIPEGSDLHCHAPPYPGRSALSKRVMQRRHEAQADLNRVNQSITHLESSLEALYRQRSAHEGRLHELAYWARNWAEPWIEQ